MKRSRLVALLVGLTALGTIGAGAAQATASVSPSTTKERPWACVGERDVNISVCLYSPVPPPPGQ